MPIAAEALWDAVYYLGSEDLPSSKIERAVIVRLIELEIVRLDSIGGAELTACGRKYFAVLQSGEGDLPQLDDYGS